MKVLIDKSFEKDIVKINDKKLLNSIADCIENIKSIKKLDQITDCKKLTGYKNSYIIKIGSYRVGFIFENQTVEFIRFCIVVEFINIFLKKLLPILLL